MTGGLIPGMYVQVLDRRYVSLVGQVVQVGEQVEIMPVPPIVTGYLVRLPATDLVPLVNYCPRCGRHDHG